MRINSLFMLYVHKRSSTRLIPRTRWSSIYYYDILIVIMWLMKNVEKIRSRAPDVRYKCARTASPCITVYIVHGYERAAWERKFKGMMMTHIIRIRYRRDPWARELEAVRGGGWFPGRRRPFQGRPHRQVSRRSAVRARPAAAAATRTSHSFPQTDGRWHSVRSGSVCASRPPSGSSCRRLHPNVRVAWRVSRKIRPIQCSLPNFVRCAFLFGPHRRSLRHRHLETSSSLGARIVCTRPLRCTPISRFKFLTLSARVDVVVPSGFCLNKQCAAQTGFPLLGTFFSKTVNFLDTARHDRGRCNIRKYYVLLLICMTAMKWYIPCRYNNKRLYCNVALFLGPFDYVTYYVLWLDRTEISHKPVHEYKLFFVL